MKKRNREWDKPWRRRGRWMAVLCIFVLLLQIGGIQVEAASLEGKKGTLSVSADSSYLYFRYEGEWSDYLSSQIQVATDGSESLGALSAISLNQNNDEESSSLTVRNAWNSAIEGAEGSVTNTGENKEHGYKSMKWSMQVPIRAYEEYSFHNMTFSWGGKSVTLAVENGALQSTEDKSIEMTTEENSGENTTEATTENVTETTTEEGNSESTTEAATKESTDKAATKKMKENIVMSGGIQVDGMYDDWDNIPKTEIGYGSNNEDCIHYGQMHTDGQRIYAHFQTSELYTSQMPIQLWYLTINGQQFALQIRPENNGSIDWGTQMPTSEGTHTNLKVFIGYGSNNECDSQAVYTIYDADHTTNTPGDDIEFSFSLERLSEITGIPVDQMGTISLSNPNLGDKSVTVAGSSTGPFVGVMAAFLLVVACYKKKKGMKKL